MNFFLSSFSPVTLWEWILLSGISWEIFDKFFRLTYSRHVSNIGGRKSRNITFSYIHTVHMAYRNWCTTFSSWLIQSNYWLIGQSRQCRKIFTPYIFSAKPTYPDPWLTCWSFFKYGFDFEGMFESKVQILWLHGVCGTADDNF